NGEASDHLSQRVAQSTQSEVPGMTIALGNFIELMRERLKLTGKRCIENQPFLLVRHFSERPVVIRPLLINARERFLTGGIDEQTIDLVEKIVASRSVDRPARGKRFVRGENLLGDDVSYASLAQLGEISPRIVQAIGMIDAQTRDL